MRYLASGLQIPGVILLYLASIQMPWSMRTWKGQSKKEKVFEKRQLLMGIVGLILVVVGMVLYWL